MIDSAPSLASVSGDSTSAQPNKLCQNTALVQSWIRTLWPIIAFVGVALMGYQSLNDRVKAIEEAQLVTTRAISEIQDMVQSMAVNQSTQAAQISTLAENTTWMRNNWGSRVGTD